MENGEYLKKVFMPYSIEVMETSISEVYGASEDTLLLHQNPGAAVNQLYQDPELVEKNAEMVENEARSEDNSSTFLHQNPRTVLNQLNQVSEMVENKETIDLDVQITNDDRSADLADQPVAKRVSAELTEQPVAKRMRLTPNLEEKVDS
ncbi:hypothetical protein F3Y22_tig00003840pilonHSYRG00004 [Hibiscus syriacus]|uniref:Uncharacterized protein n=1 Tax=Hibiscus syriacus TaxID=106335 RepID=A0A6A3CK21_HIBSY|nr:hypothetical protein F3Y22_tig00003840pilonHSYRG00004 [Hibiscus syriacus]